MEYLESIRSFYKKLIPKNKVYTYLKNNFKKVDEYEDDWGFTLEYPMGTYSVRVRIIPRQPMVENSERLIKVKINRYGHGQYDHMWPTSEFDISFKDLNNLKNEIFKSIEESEMILWSLSKRDSEIIEKHNRLRKDLSDELPISDIEEILTDIKDLSIVTFEIKMHVTSDNDKPFYAILFKIDKNSNDVEQFSELYKLIGESIRRIRNTYNVEVKWSQSMKRIMINLP